MITCYVFYKIVLGYTICWDNVGKLVRARHHTRNVGNRYQTWALSYAAKNRIPTTHMTSSKTVPATQIPIQNYMLANSEQQMIKER